MIRLVVLVCSVLVLAIPRTVYAESAVQWRYEDQNISIVFSGVANRATTFKVQVGDSHHEAKIWIDDLNIPSTNAPGDNLGIQSLELRRGVGRTSVVNLQFAEGVIVSPSDFSLVTDEGTTTITVKVDPSLIAEWSRRQTHSDQVSESILKSETKPREKQAPETMAKGTEKKTTPLKLAKNKTLKSENLVDRTMKGRGDSSQSSDRSEWPAITAVLVFGLLAAVFGYFQTRKARKVSANFGHGIDIVDTKRLGPKHQLLLISVNECNYLLSVNGDKATRIASVPKDKTKLSELSTNAFSSAPAEEHLGDADPVPNPFDSEIKRLSNPRKRKDAKSAQTANGILQLRRRLESFQKAG